MAILTRIVAAATLASLVFVDIAGASAAENYALAAQRARAHGHHERAAHVNAAGREHRKKRDVQKRCKASTTSISSHPATSAPPATTSHKAAPTSTHVNVVTTTSHKAATTSAAKPAESSAAPASPAPGGGGKKYFAWGGDNSQLSLIKGHSNLGGIANWGPNPPTVEGVFPICQLWGEKSLSAFRTNREKYTHLMGMNEVNLDAQASLSVSQTIQMWNAEIRPYGKGRTLYAPSVTTAPGGIPYLQDFFDGCGTISSISDSHCGVDVLQAHYYGKDSADAIKYMQTLHSTFYNLPVLMSEMACQSFVDTPTGRDCTASEAKAYLQGVTNWCLSTDWCVGVAPFGFMDDLGNVNPVNALLSGNSLTSLGSWFLNA